MTSRFQSVVFFVVLFALATVGRAQFATVPRLNGDGGSGSSVVLTIGGSSTVDLRTIIIVPGVTGQVVQFDTVLGKWNVELLTTAAPINSANFLRYVNAGSYANTFIHRVVPAFVVQGGGYTSTVPFVSIARPTTAPLEYNLPNTRGTLAMARTSDINSASSEWFVNTVDNSTTLNPSNGGGYTVFGRVLGTGMSVVDAIAAQPLYNVGFDSTGAASTPLRNVQTGQTTVQAANYITVNSVRTIPMYPLVAGETALLGFTATSANVAVVTTAITGSTLTLSGVAAGVAAVTVRGTDIQGNAAQAVFSVTVAGGVPVITAQPLGATVTTGQTVALNIAATGDGLGYEWRKNGIAAAIAGATGPTLILPNVTVADAGGYVCRVSNSSAITFSESATVSVGAAGQNAKLSNLSVRANLSAGQILIVGFSTTAKKDLLVRGVGPKLADFGLANFYADPRLEISASGGNAATSNDDWDVSLEPTFARVGAFPLDRGSKDAAIVTPVTGGATAQLKGTGSGFVLVEVYDAGGGLTPRLTNVSARNRVGTGSDVLIAGFTIEGPVAKTLLIRGVGPKLTAFGVAGALEDPKLEIYKTNGTKLAENDNWTATVGGFFSGLGAFALDAGSKDAALLITLPPGGYTAQLSGVGATTGEGLIEVYELP
jgi:cyclophilin family peptidyl-prolyl cis-trans isomerase